uniref:Uncharacterized protein n=1 Tax=Romanomermis culicivorax TaxID=13658 RepID=A0A915KYB6_ROMCU
MRLFAVVPTKAALCFRRRYVAHFASTIGTLIKLTPFSTKEKIDSQKTLGNIFSLVPFDDDWFGLMARLNVLVQGVSRKRGDWGSFGRSCAWAFVLEKSKFHYGFSKSGKISDD